MSGNSTIIAICRTESIQDFRAFLADVARCSNPRATDSRDDERRKHRRNLQKLVLLVQPLDENFRPLGRSFHAVTQDISSTGLGFAHDSPFPTDFVRIGATIHSPAQVIARVCFNRSSPDRRHGYLIGVEFLANENDLSS